ncbi:MAG: DUF4403 family protein [Pseudobacter sp.]|uniref:DUF4403 family protein n=1 Tax=Pseudobacter sp. TaxID=2045420 RepID=UPI003F7D0C5F
MTSITRVLGLGIALIFFLSCGSSKKSTTVTSTLTPPPARSLPALPQSYINIPVKIYMKPLLSVMESSTAKEFTNDKWPNYTQSSCDFRYKYRFIRSPFVFNVVNNKVTIAFRGDYQIAGSRALCAFDKQVSPWVNGSCGFNGEPLRRVDIAIGSQLTLMPNHSVNTVTHLEKLQPLDKCEVTIMNNDMTKDVLDSVKASIETYCTTFDKFVQDLNNNVLLANWRKGGSRVMPISKYGFLNLNLSALGVSRFNVQKDTLYFSMGFSGFPRFNSDSNKLVTHAALPPVSNADRIGNISTWLDAVYEYKFFNKLLNDSLRNKPFEIDGRTFVIKDVNISGTYEGKIKVDLSFSGNRTGVISLTGTPTLDTARQVLSMPDIKVGLDTKDLMVNLAKGLIKKKIMKELAGQSVLDLQALIQKNRTLIEARLNQQVTSWMSTSGSIQEIKLLGILPQEKHIQIQAFIRASISLTGRPPANLVSLQ